VRISACNESARSGKTAKLLSKESDLNSTFDLSSSQLCIFAKVFGSDFGHIGLPTYCDDGVAQRVCMRPKQADTLLPPRYPATLHSISRPNKPNTWVKLSQNPANDFAINNHHQQRPHALALSSARKMNGLTSHKDRGEKVGRSKSDVIIQRINPGTPVSTTVLSRFLVVIFSFISLIAHSGRVEISKLSWMWRRVAEVVRKAAPRCIDQANAT
jgi:hypothetical protein